MRSPGPPDPVPGPPRTLARIAAGVLAGLVAVLTGCMPSHRMTPHLAPSRTCPATEGIAWYFPEPGADNERLEEWCLTVGPPIHEPEPGAAFGRLRSGDTLAVVAWNAAVGNGDFVGLLRDGLGLVCDRSTSILGEGRPHFALLVQEAFRRSAAVPETGDDRVMPRRIPEHERPGERLDVAQVATRCGLALAYVPSARNGPGPVDGLREDRGVAILSTLPLRDLVAIELPYEAARRVALAATVRGGSDVELRLVSVHLISTTPPTRVLTTGNGSRLRQGLALADALEQLEAARAEPGASSRPAPISTVAAGDFNTWSDRETTLRRLREAFPDSPPPLGVPTHGAFPTDHVLFRASGSYGAPALVEGSYARLEDPHHSDHHAIAVRVRFGE